MQDTTATLPDTGQTPDNSTPWSTHPGYALSRHTLNCRRINDRDRYTPNSMTASVKALKFTDDKVANVRLSLEEGPASIYADMSAHSARTLARALLGAADIVEAFEAFEADRAETAELARYNAGPLTTRVDIADGLVAFETVTKGGAA